MKKVISFLIAVFIMVLVFPVGIAVNADGDWTPPRITVDSTLESGNKIKVSISIASAQQLTGQQFEVHWPDNVQYESCDIVNPVWKNADGTPADAVEPHTDEHKLIYEAHSPDANNKNITNKTVILNVYFYFFGTI